MRMAYGIRRGITWLVSALIVCSVALGATALFPRQIFAHGNLNRTAPTITRTQILARARTWVDAGVPYNQGGWYRGYREDCSGFVSMAWALTQSYTTYTLDVVAQPIARNALQPGDILNKRDDIGGSAHALLFAGWADAAHITYNAYEETPAWGGAHYTTDIPFPYWPGTYRTVTDYQPMRLNGLANFTPAIPTGPHAPSTSIAAAGPATIYIGDVGSTLHALDAPHARELWRYQASGPLTSLVAANGQVTLAAQSPIVDVRGHRSLTFTALNATTGVVLWHWISTCLTGPSASPFACEDVGQAAGAIFVASGTTLTALDAATGQPRWSYATGAATISGFTTAGASVYLSATTPQSGDQASVVDIPGHATQALPAAPATTGTLVALNAATGSLLWSTPTAGAVASGELVATADGVYAAVQVPQAAGQDIEAFDSHTGSGLWHVAVLGDATGLTVLGGTMYLTITGSSQAGGLNALAARTGQRLWNVPCGTGAPLVTATAVYTVCTAASGAPRLEALDPASGLAFWQRPLGATGDTLAIATLADGNVYATATRGATVPTTTPTANTTNATNATLATPAVASAAGASGAATVFALDAAAGAVLWQRAGTLAAAGRGRACVASATGTLTVVAARSGASNWLFELGGLPSGALVSIAA